MHQVKEIIVTTGEEIEREMTEQEFAEYESNLQEELAKQAEQAAKEAARQSALDKLAALGLTSEEIQAIAGN